jgi:hypothetical protein
MKLKKAIREHAIAIDALATVTNEIRHTDDLLWVHDMLLRRRDEARKEYKRTLRQIKAVMSAMQYRGKNYYDPEYLSRINLNTVTTTKNPLSLFMYMYRLKNGVSDWETKRKLAKRACEHYLKFGDLSKGRYEIEDTYYNVFGERVRLLEH